MPQAIASIWDILQNNKYSSVEKKSAVEEADSILGLKLFINVLIKQRTKHIRIHPEIMLISSKKISDEMRLKIIDLAEKRRKARESKDFIAADRLRDEFKVLGIDVRDLPDGITECELK